MRRDEILLSASMLLLIGLFCIGAAHLLSADHRRAHEAFWLAWIGWISAPVAAVWLVVEGIKKTPS